jgi:hypothetical protein
VNTDDGVQFPDGNSHAEWWWEVVQRIARTCAARGFGGHGLNREDRYEAAYTAIVEYLCEEGWPSDEKPLYRAGTRGISQAGAEYARHWTARAVGYWHEPPAGIDAVGEAITDRIAIHQLTWAFTEKQWEAVWALAEVMKRDGSYRDAARLLGKPEASYHAILTLARNRARALWVAPGETPRKHWAKYHGEPKHEDQARVAYRLRVNAKRSAQRRNNDGDEAA